MTFEQRFNVGDVEIREDGGVTRILGYAAVFNRYSSDLGGFVERILPGAFKRVLERGDEIQAWFNHNPDNLLASREAGTLLLSEDKVGLRYEIQVDPSDPDHQRVLAKIRRGDLRGSSFGFRITSDGDEWGTTEQDYPLRSVKNVAVLRDVGPVSTPAYPDTKSVGQLALRSLADLTGVPVDELVEAGPSLRDFLIRQAEDVSADDADNVASGDTDAALPDQQSESKSHWNDLTLLEAVVRATPLLKE